MNKFLSHDSDHSICYVDDSRRKFLFAERYLSRLLTLLSSLSEVSLLHILTLNNNEKTA
jgi:hypothetical protein